MTAKLTPRPPGGPADRHHQIMIAWRPLPPAPDFSAIPTPRKALRFPPSFPD
ncbi:hypothetical protein MVEN_02547100 [Mycena venus]|uniref:Uncharacterized protein n=1 Tax=Mycena venus TaxID=2733690 RepID=A0A8H6U3Q8_9AGAR|nr:hypothetical protein MVEN_02547100 [Mycena venus]